MSISCLLCLRRALIIPSWFFSVVDCVQCARASWCYPLNWSVQLTDNIAVICLICRTWISWVRRQGRPFRPEVNWDNTMIISRITGQLHRSMSSCRWYFKKLSLHRLSKKPSDLLPPLLRRCHNDFRPGLRPESCWDSYKLLKTP